MSVIDRFLRYVRYDTTSDEASETVPSTESQRTFGAYLVTEMRAAGLCDVRMDDHGYLYGFLPATADRTDIPALGLIAHMDTSPAVSGKDIKPSVVTYRGGILTLASGSEMDPADYPFMEHYIGEDLIVTDGTTLLGADDKAGVAEILETVSYLTAHPEISHRAIAVAFTPDEEIGRGADYFDVEHFPARVAYTVDGGEIGEIEYENFNAAGATVRVTGFNIHPGTAKGRMKNAVLMANEFISMLPPAETPAHTEGYEGFYHVTDMQGDESSATVSLIIRDHDRTKFEARKAFLQNVCAYLEQKWGKGSFVLSMQDSYYNMWEQIEDGHMDLIKEAEDAMRSVGVVPNVIPIRGGTDGARLSFMGIPCPNLSTGGANFHGIHECIPTRAMEQMVAVLRYLVR